MDKKNNEKGTAIHTCYVCEKPIEGDCVYIRTRRRTELYIHFGCMPGRNLNDGRTMQDGGKQS